MAAVKTILHVIDSLDRAGAELIFVNYINALPPDFENIVVHLRQPDTLAKELRNVKKVYTLNFQNKYSLIKVAIQLNRIIKENKVSLIHSHLFWSTLVCRLAKPRRVPLVFSVHNLISQDAFRHNRGSLWAEKLTYRSNQTALFVSDGVRADYCEHINVTGKKAVLYNFVADVFFKKEYSSDEGFLEGVRLVSVGHLRKQKNHNILLQAMGMVKEADITLDIYGDGPEYESLLTFIEVHKLSNVRLMGGHQAPEQVLKNYDAFIIASEYEGFCVAMAEAMAVGLTCVVSDIRVLKEVSGAEQIYFDNTDKEKLAALLKALLNNKNTLSELSSKAKAIAARYTIHNHVQQLCSVYKKALIK